MFWSLLCVVCSSNTLALSLRLLTSLMLSRQELQVGGMELGSTTFLRSYTVLANDRSDHHFGLSFALSIRWHSLC